MSAFFAVLVIFFVFPKTISAQIVLNEFSAKTDPEWVELYNNSDAPIDLEGWEIADGNSISSDDLTLSGEITPLGFLVFERPKGWLNDGGDTVKLYNNATPSGELVGSFTYNSASADTTTSRIPDGSGDFIYNTNPTKGEANQAPPTQTPTEEPTPTSTPTSSPTSTQTPTSTPTSTPKVSHTSTLTITPEVLSATTDSGPYSVFIQESTVSASASSQSASVKSKPGVNLTLVGLGLLTLSGSVLFFRNNPY